MAVAQGGKEESDLRRSRLRYARGVKADDETVIRATPNASWLPVGGTAEVVRRASVPRPMCMVRLLLRRADTVFCVPRPETCRLDLPTEAVGAGDTAAGLVTIAALADQVFGSSDGLTFVGAVRNIVQAPEAGYAWPTPHAYFGVWTSSGDPVVQGRWLALGEASELRDRHWFPLAE